MLPEALSNGACSLVPGAGAPRGHRRARAATARTCGAGAFYRSRDPLRRAARLRPGRPDLRRRGARARAVGGAAGRRARGVARRCASAREAAARWRSSRPSRSSPSTAAATYEAAAAREQTESHRLIEHLMIAANEAVARLLDRPRASRRCTASTSGPSPRASSAWSTSSRRSASPTPPLPEHMPPAAGRRHRRRDLAAGRPARAPRDGRGRRGLTSLVLRSLKQAALLAAATSATPGLRSPRYCHFTSPIRRYPDLVCHRALLSAVGGGEDAPRRQRAGGGRRVDVGARARRDGDRARRRRRRALLPARARALRARAGPEFDGEVVGLIGAGAFVAFGDGYEGLLPVRRLRGDWWELNEQGTILVGARVGRRDAHRRPGDACGRARSTRPAAGWTSSGPVAALTRQSMAKGKSARRRRATSPPTGRRRSGTSCSTSSRPASCSRAPRSSRCARPAPSSRTATRRSATASCGCTTSTSRPTRPAARENHEPERPRKLLLHRREIERLSAGRRARPDARPDADVLHGPRAKVEIALARGKDRFDKRESIKEREQAARRRARAARRRPLSVALQRALEVRRVHRQDERGDEPEVRHADDDPVAARDL